MNYIQNHHFYISDQQEKRLKHTRITCAVLAVLLFLSIATVFWLSCRLRQLNQKHTSLLSDAQQLLQEKTDAEQELTRVRQNLADTESKFEESFNLLYPAYVAVENIRYIGIGSQTYHYFNCSLFSKAEIYTAHNTEYCITLGYTPCPVCCPE